MSSNIRNHNSLEANKLGGAISVGVDSKAPTTARFKVRSYDLEARSDRGKLLDYPMFQLVLIGDSDIAFWPEELYPIFSTKKSDDETARVPTIGSTIVHGHAGATLNDLVQRFEDIRRKVFHPQGWGEAGHSRDGRDERSLDLIVVACAGENDIGSGISLDHSVSSLESFLERVFSLGTKPDGSTGNATEITSLRVAACIFLGPKYEPWLEDDVSYKKKYSKMARSFERCCQRSTHSARTHFVDCLTLFCGETANLPGAKLAGRAVAQADYFAPDRLHLSHNGYRMWKNLVEQKILQIL